MPTRQPDVVRISSPSDVVCAISQILGFFPTDSVVALCTHGPRSRLGLAMRFDLELARDPVLLAEAIDARARHDGADGAFIVVYPTEAPRDGLLPHDDLAGEVMAAMGDLVLDLICVSDGRWWSYLCDEPTCCGRDGTAIDPRSAGATALAAAYALAGQGVLPDRGAVVRSIAYGGSDDDAATMADRIEAAWVRQAAQSQAVRRLAVRALVGDLSAALADPRRTICDDDLAELAALCDDVVVRDEVLIRGIKPRRRQALLRVMREAVQVVPPPFDAPVCATLAWLAYADGDGVLANVALDRALSTDPAYSLALLIADALERQVPPHVLEEVMRGAARDLRGRSAAG
jgi:hypothetical protein